MSTLSWIFVYNNWIDLKAEKYLSKVASQSFCGLFVHHQQHWWKLLVLIWPVVITYYLMWFHHDGWTYKTVIYAGHTYLRLNEGRNSFNINGSHNASIYHETPTKFERLLFVANFGKTYVMKMYAKDTINRLEHDHHMRRKIECGRRSTDCLNCEPFIKE